MKKYNYIFKEDVDALELHSKISNKDRYRTHWAYPEKPASLKGKDVQFETVGCNEIIIDVDGNNDSGNYHLDDGLKVVQDIMLYLNDLFPNLNINVYYSGLKGYHISIPLDTYYEFNTEDVGKGARVVIAYHNFLNVLRHNINIPNTIKLDNALTQATRLIQLANKKKIDNNSKRGFKICIANSKNEEFPSWLDIRNATNTNMNIVSRLRNSNKNVKGFVEFLTDKLGEELKLDKPSPVKRPTDSDNLGDLQIGLNPILNELDKKYKQDGHQNIRTPLLYTVKAYLPDLDDAMPFIDFLCEDERHGDKSNNARQSLINAFNNGEGNKFALYGKLGIKSDKEFDKRSKEGKEAFNENEKVRNIFYTFLRWLEDYKDSVEHKKTLKQGKEFAREVQENKNDLVTWYAKNLPEYLGTQNHKNLLFMNTCALAVNLGTLLTKLDVEGDSEGGKDQLNILVEAMNPNYKYIGNITSKAFIRTAFDKGERAFDRTIIYLGDKTLKTQSRNDEEEYNEIEGIIGELVTRGEDGIERTVSSKSGEGTETFRLKVSGLMQINTGTYINKSPHGAGRQQETRTIAIAIAPVTEKQVEHLYLRDDETAEKEHEQQKEFMVKYKAYQMYVAENPIKVIIDVETKKEILAYTKSRARSLKRTTAIFKAYCNFIRVENPTVKDWIKFKEVLPINTDLNPIESEFFEKIIKGTMAPCGIFKNNPDDEICKDDYLKDLLSRRCSKTKEAVFFTVTGLRTYRRNWLLHNANLRDVGDRIPEILKNLESKGYIRRLEEIDERGENIYYWTNIKYDEDLE